MRPITGRDNVLIFGIYTAGLLLVLRPIRSVRDGKVYVGHFILLCAVMYLFTAVYYSFFGDSYLNQVMEITATAMLIAYPAKTYEKGTRCVIGCTAWSAHTLFISINFSLGLSSDATGKELLAICTIVIEHILLFWFLNRFAMSTSILPSGYHVIGSLVLAFSGAVASSNWNIGDTWGLHSFSLSLSLLAEVLIVYYLLYKNTVETLVRIQSEAKTRTLEMNQMMVRLTEENLKDMRQIRHDLKNHFGYASMLLAQENYAGLKDYFDRLSEKTIVPLSYIDCGNRVLNEIINLEIAKANTFRLKIETELIVPEHLPIEDADLCSLLTNLLDNALEACERVKVCVPVRVSIYTKADYIYISVLNAIDEQVNRKEILERKTSKSDVVSHGLGKEIVQKIVSRYNGAIQYQIQGNMHIVDVMMDMKESGG